MNQNTHHQVKELLAEVFQVPSGELADDLIFGDIPQWDSMGHMEVMMSLEQKYGVEITADTIGGLISLEAICTYLERNGHV